MTPRRRRGAQRARFDLQKMERGIRLFLEGLGEVARREDIRESPRLVARAFAEELLSGYLAGETWRLKPLSDAPPEALVVVKGIQFVSICRHHLLPFQGTAAVAYLPSERLAGFSSVARLVDVLARRLQIQESLSEEILGALEEALAPQGSACLLEATHQCMTCRGARQSRSRVSTLSLQGVFRQDPARRREVVALLSSSGGARTPR